MCHSSKKSLKYAIRNGTQAVPYDKFSINIRLGSVSFLLRQTLFYQSGSNSVLSGSWCRMAEVTVLYSCRSVAFRSRFCSLASGWNRQKRYRQFSFKRNMAFLAPPKWMAYSSNSSPKKASSLSAVVPPGVSIPGSPMSPLPSMTAATSGYAAEKSPI